MKSDIMLFLELQFTYILSGNNGPRPALPGVFAAFFPLGFFDSCSGSYSFLFRR